MFRATELIFIKGNNLQIEASSATEEVKHYTDAHQSTYCLPTSYKT